jgi:hypothetical protein
MKFNRICLLIAVISFLFVGFTAYVLADEVVPASETALESIEASVDSLSLAGSVWLFLNSPIGLSVVAFILTFITGKIFTAKPKWKQYVLKYGPEIMRAVKIAEKKVSDGSKIDEALKYLIELEPKLKGATEADLKQALTAVHTSAEANGNLK